LPLDRRAIKSVAVIGPLADSERDTLGPWVFKPVNPQAVSVLTGLRAKVGTAVRIDYSEGVRMPPRLHPSPSANLDKQPERPPLDETAEIRRAVTLAQHADVTVLVLGEGQAMIGGCVTSGPTVPRNRGASRPASATPMAVESW
jgi:beta-glucosidase